jgi:GNAT superfamily N-acetyltransferase
VIHSIKAAQPRDAHHVTTIVTAAFAELAVAGWLVPDPDHRHRVLYRHFRLLVEHALCHGRVLISTGRSATAIWLPRDRPLPQIPDYPQRLQAACGRYAERFRELDALFDKHHPTHAHHHLALLAVLPSHQGQGLGTALLGRYHRMLDRIGMPAYLQAASPAARTLYLRHGYTDHGDPIDLPDSPTRLWPMWRHPLPAHDRGATRTGGRPTSTTTSPPDGPAAPDPPPTRHLPPAGNHQHLQGTDRAAWRNEYAGRYQQGHSIRQIARATGRSYGFTARLLREAGVRMRPRGGSTTRHTPPSPPPP